MLPQLLFLVYVNDIWRNVDSSIRLLTDDCAIYRKITNKNDIEKLQKDLNKLGEWAVENGVKINLGKFKAIRYTRAWVRISLGYSLCDQKIPGTSSCKYLVIIIWSDLNWVDQVNFTAQKAWKAFHFVMRVLKKGNRNTNSLAYTSLVRPVLKYGATCWDPYREGQINVLDRVHMKAAQFNNHTKGSVWETLAQHRTTACLCALFKAYSGDWAWKAIRNRLGRPSYLNRADHVRKIRDRKQRTDIGKYSFVNRTIKNWNQLPAEAFGDFSL